MSHPFDGPELFDDTPAATIDIEEIWPNTHGAIQSLRAGRHSAAAEALRAGEVVHPPTLGCGLS